MMQSKYKKWLINIFIVIIAAALMLIVAEIGMRVIDGYRLTNIELKQDTTE